MGKEHIKLFFAFLLAMGYLFASIGTKESTKKDVYLLIHNFWLGILIFIGLVIQE